VDYDAIENSSPTTGNSVSDYGLPLLSCTDQSRR
jgi:hypothetical protein